MQTKIDELHINFGKLQKYSLKTFVSVVIFESPCTSALSRFVETELRFAAYI